ncbi:MAG: hypothetical protein AAF934_11540, partial [Bacteroidota bacterium]
MQRFKDILKKLFDRKYIDKKTKEASNYDLLTEILKKRRNNKRQLQMIRHRHMELDAFHEIILETEDL